MEKKEKKENEKKGLPSGPDLALGKYGVCRVSDLGHWQTTSLGPTHAQ